MKKPALKCHQYYMPRILHQNLLWRGQRPIAAGPYPGHALHNTLSATMLGMRTGKESCPWMECNNSKSRVVSARNVLLHPWQLASWIIFDCGIEGFRWSRKHVLHRLLPFDVELHSWWTSILGILRHEGCSARLSPPPGWGWAMMKFGHFIRWQSSSMPRMGDEIGRFSCDQVIVITTSPLHLTQRPEQNALLPPSRAKLVTCCVHRIALRTCVVLGERMGNLQCLQRYSQQPAHQMSCSGSKRNYSDIRHPWKVMRSTLP